MPSFIGPFLQKLASSHNADPSKLVHHLQEMLRYNWFLGFTSFGGPAVHFQIVSTYLLSARLCVARDVM